MSLPRVRSLPMEHLCGGVVSALNSLIMAPPYICSRPGTPRDTEKNLSPPQHLPVVSPSVHLRALNSSPLFNGTYPVDAIEVQICVDRRRRRRVGDYS